MYLIKGMRDEHREKFRGAGVAFSDFGIDQILFEDQGTVDRALAAINAALVEAAPTDMEGITEYKINFLPPPAAAVAPATPAGDVGVPVVEVEPVVPVVELKKRPKVPDAMGVSVSVDFWDGGKDRALFLKALEVLLPYVKRNIVLTVPHGQLHEPSDDLNFHVYLWSGYKKSKVPVPEKIFGIPVGCKSHPNIFTAGDKGEVIKDGDYAVAELVGKNLFIFHDICHHTSEDELKMFKIILDKVIDLKLPVPPTAEEVAAENRKSFTEYCMGTLDNRIQSIQSTVSANSSEVDKLKRALVEKSRILYSSESALRELVGSKDSQRSKFNEEYEDILKIKHVLDLKIGRQVLKVFTDILTCKDKDNVEHELGRFEIDIHFDGAIKFFNKTRQVNAYSPKMHAPNVGEDGIPLVDKFSTAVPDLLGNMKYKDLIRMVIAYVSTYDRSSETVWGKLKEWPKIETSKE